MTIMLKGIDLPKEYTQVIAITPNGEVWQVNPRRNADCNGYARYIFTDSF